MIDEANIGDEFDAKTLRLKQAHAMLALFETDFGWSASTLEEIKNGHTPRSTSNCDREWISCLIEPHAAACWVYNLRCILSSEPSECFPDSSLGISRWRRFTVVTEAVNMLARLLRCA
jgi:hypothetical protein